MGSSDKASASKKNRGKKEKRKVERSNDGAKEVVTDARFASVHSDPRFQNIARRERKVSIDPRFDKMFTDRDFGSSAAPVDKRGKRKERKENPLQRYYELEEGEGKEEDGMDSGDAKVERKVKKVKFSGVAKECELENEDEEVGVQSSDESDDMEEYDSQLSDVEVNTDDEMLLGESESEADEQEEEVPEIDQETRRLAAVNLDWHHMKAVDLYALLNSFLPDGGRVLSVSVYPSEFGLQRMKEESVRGPVGLFDDDDKKSTDKIKNYEDSSDEDSENQEHDEEDSDDKGDGRNESEDDSRDGNDSDDGDDSRDENDEDTEDELSDNDDEEGEEEEEEDKDYIAAKIRNYEKTRLRYYFAVVCCDSIATANHLYKECDGIEIMQSSNKLDLRYIPDSMEFKQEARDVATEVPSGYKPSDFFTKALQLSKPVLTWDEDEPERAKTLKRKFNADELDKLELNEFLASDASDSDDDDDDDADNQSAKKHNKADAYRSLLSGGGAEEEEDDNSDDDDGQDMEVTFNSGLEDISKRIIEKRENKSETVWEAHLRKRQEKRKAKKSKKDSSEDSDDNDDGEGIDDFFSDGPQLKRSQVGSKIKGDKTSTDNIEANREAGASRAELELLLADDKEAESHIKGYKIKPGKTKGKKKKELVDDKKIPEVDLDDPRFQSLFKNPQFALDPTDPQFKRSAAYRRQLAEKQKKAEQDSLLAKGHAVSLKPAKFPSDEIDKNLKSQQPSSNSNKYEISSMVKSIKMKTKEADKRDKSKLSSVAQSLKKKTKGLIS